MEDAEKSILSAREKGKGVKRRKDPWEQKIVEDADGLATPCVLTEPRPRSRSFEDLYHPLKVSVRGLPNNMTEADILDYFSECGVISEISCKTCPNSGNFVGRAWITFATRKGATKSLEYDGSDNGWHVEVRRCKLKTQTQAQATASMPYVGDVQRIPGSLFLCLSNLSENVTAETITAFFKKSYSASKIWPRGIRFFYEKSTGNLMGVAHFACDNEETLEAAVKLNQTPLLGRPVKIAYAPPLREFRYTLCNTVGGNRYRTRKRCKPLPCDSCGKDKHQGVCPVTGFYSRTLAETGFYSRALRTAPMQSVHTYLT